MHRLFLLVIVTLMTNLFPANAQDQITAPPPPVINRGYWLMSSGNPVGYNIAVEINNSKVTTMKWPNEALEVTHHLHPGLNTIRFIARDNGRVKNPANSSPEAMFITLGPEAKREKQGTLSRTYIQLKELMLQFQRPILFRAPESTVEMRLSINYTPNPQLTKRFVLFSQGSFTGHMIHVALNGVPLIDVMSPGSHFDLNPFLLTGPNELTFSASLMDAFPMTSADRQALTGKSLEIGVGVAGSYNPDSFNEPVTSLQSVIGKFSQPGDQEQPEPSEALTVVAD